MIELKKIPYVDEHVNLKLWSMDANDVMTHNPVTLRRIERVNKILKILKSFKHNGFPVVSNNTST